MTPLTFNEIEDCEMRIDGKQLFILQARPETIHSLKEGHVIEKYVLKEKGKVLTTGSSVGEKIGQGNVRVIADAKKIKDFKKPLNHNPIKAGALEHEEITKKIIGCAYRVYNTMGFGYLESVYE